MDLTTPPKFSVALPGARSSNGLPGRLYLGERHLLLFESGMGSERYRYLAYEDIRGIVVRQTAAWWLSLLALVVVVALLGALLWYGAAQARSSGAPWGSVDLTPTLLFFAVSVLLATVVLLGRGATCRTTLLTAAGTYRLPSLGRVKVARKAIARLQERLRLVQGDLPPEQVAVRMEEFLQARGRDLQPGGAPNGLGLSAGRRG